MTLLLTSGLHRSYQLIFKKNTNYFYAVRIGISLDILSEILIKLISFSKSYARKEKWLLFLVAVIFLNPVYVMPFS